MGGSSTATACSAEKDEGLLVVVVVEAVPLMEKASVCVLEDENKAKSSAVQATSDRIIIVMVVALALFASGQCGEQCGRSTVKGSEGSQHATSLPPLDTYYCCHIASHHRLPSFAFL